MSFVCFRSHFGFYKSCDDRWKNSVRHNLSMNPYFRKGAKAKGGSGHLWMLANVEGRRFRRNSVAARMGRPNGKAGGEPARTGDFSDPQAPVNRRPGGSCCAGWSLRWVRPLD